MLIASPLLLLIVLKNLYVYHYVPTLYINNIERKSERVHSAFCVHFGEILGRKRFFKEWPSLRVSYEVNWKKRMYFLHLPLVVLFLTSVEFRKFFYNLFLFFFFSFQSFSWFSGLLLIRKRIIIISNYKLLSKIFSKTHF